MYIFICYKTPLQSTNITDLFFWSNWWIVKLTMCAKVCHVDERMSILLIGQTEFKIAQSRACPINRSTWMRVAAISKLVATPTLINYASTSTEFLNRKTTITHNFMLPFY